MAPRMETISSQHVINLEHYGIKIWLWPVTHISADSAKILVGLYIPATVKEKTIMDTEHSPCKHSVVSCKLKAKKAKIL